LRASALTSWRGVPVVATEAGGLFRRRGGRWEEARSGWGRLEVRTLVETEAGELLLGARQGLFRAAFGSASLERLLARPVRTVAVGRGVLYAGGEEGLFQVEGRRAPEIAAPDSWIESVAVIDETMFVATPSGLARGPRRGPLLPVGGAEDVAEGVAVEGAFWGLSWPRRASVKRITREGVAEEPLPAPVLSLLAADGALFADTEDGLYRRGAEGWRRVRPRPTSALPPGAAHLSALALLGDRLVAGVFDGGLALADDRAGSRWRAVPGSEAWGVNALLPAGGQLYVASLRGAARFDGTRLHPIEGPGAAFALAATDAGVAIGYAQGVRLPGASLLSAFHGLPGNQALALAGGPELFVGTPSGLGALRGRRVAFRVAAGEARLPHPWVTALVHDDRGLLVGTYGGGVARRIPRPGHGPDALRADGARYEPFPETEGLKVNAGGLLRARGRTYLGTDGRGLWRSSLDGARFERLSLGLPSPRVTALAASEETLYVGTDEGLALLPLGAEW
jgi:ligand-binding sensor domain-containing protein